MTRTALLILVLALYAIVLGRGPARRAIGTAGFDPLSPQASAVERRLVAGRFDEALSLATALKAAHPDEPLAAYWLATIDQHLGRSREEADAWSEYVRTSKAPGVACPAWPEAYRRSGQTDRAREASARCVEIASR